MADNYPASQGRKRYALTLDVDETLGDFEFSSGDIPLCVGWVATGRLYFYDSTDSTTADDGLTCLVTANGLRYHVDDSATVSLNAVESATATPPGSPSVGQVWRVDTAGTGAFAGHDDDLAIYTRRGWVFAAPEIGHTVLNKATGYNEQFSASGWGAFAATIGGGAVYPSKLLAPFGVSVETETNTPPGSPSNGQFWLTGASPTGAWAGYARRVAGYEAGAWTFYANYGGAAIYNKASRAELTYDASTGLWSPVWPIAPTCQGRLTLESGVAISTSDQTAKATLYFTPFRGNAVALYIDGGWALRSFAELSLSLAGYTSGKPFDIFLYDNAGTLTLESLVWTNDSTRATAIELQDGIYVKSGDATRRYLGTIYTTATGQCEDSARRRYCWNYYNRVARELYAIETDDTWTYTSTSIRQANGDGANQVETVTGVAEDVVQVNLQAVVNNSSQGRIGIGLDSTTSFAAGSLSSEFGAGTGKFVGTARYGKVPAVGRHYYAWLERGSGGGITYLGDDGGAFQSGLSGVVWG